MSQPTTEPVPPSLQAPTAKEKKYDRQLRLWGSRGQVALEESHILLINSGPGAVGVETLKNLVLPGIGNFTIQDSAIVDWPDLGVNFFLEEQHVGGYRAEHTCNLLKELNPDVSGNFITEPVELFLNQPNALQPYTLILVTAPIRPELLAQLSAHASATNNPIFYIHSVGFYSLFSIQLPPAFPVVDTHPDPETITDLRLLSPWPELIQYAKEKTEGLESMSHDDHGHMPYVCLLLYYLEQWKKEHDGKVPQNYKEKTAFRELVTKAARTDNPEGGEENYDEATAAVLKSLNPSEPSSGVKEVFKADECLNLNAESPSFWIITRAIANFYQKHSTLPLPGSVPDMKARSVDYIQLQNVYKAKARKDLAEVLDDIRSLEQDLGKETTVDGRDVEIFCKNAAHIKLVRGRPLHVVQPGKAVEWGDRAKSLAPALTFPDTLLPLYIAFLALDEYTATHDKDGLGGAAKVPGESDVEADFEKVTGISRRIIDDLLKAAGSFIQNPDYTQVLSATGEYVQELVRAGGGELHNIASLTGGLVSQEVIKVITEQYIPVDNTCVFDGVKSKTGVLRI
jgi:amyloid beta precursor protein binding protein 1